ncbi:hypothetical protein [Clostridium sp.]|uniref:hypothetical protein n=1 Tax=Clostridium sp. TaxID=1506 RepID=UPI003F3EC0FB
MIYKITTNSAPIKVQPLSNAEIVNRMDINTQIDVIEIVDRWAAFIYDDNICYISNIYIKKVDTEECKFVETEDTQMEEEDINTIEKIDNSSREAKSIVVRYIDNNSSQDIISPIVYNDTNLDSNVYEAVEIFGYNVLGDSTQEVVILSDYSDLEIVFKYEKILGKITIQYIDYDNQVEISPAVIYENLDLNSYTLNSKYIPGYFNIEYSYYEVDLDKYNTEKNIQFNYKKILGKITVKYVDIISREEIIPPTVINDIEPDKYIYSAKELPGYKVVGLDSKSINIDDTLTNCEIYFEYRLWDVKNE